MTTRQIYVVELRTGYSPFEVWYYSVHDLVARRKVLATILRLASSEFRNYKNLRDGLFELRIFYGPGFRVYFSFLDPSSVLLVYGGTKKSQRKDIYEAKKIWQKYKESPHRTPPKHYHSGSH